MRKAIVALIVGLILSSFAPATADPDGLILPMCKGTINNPC
jgi:hypothetical protein